MTETPNYGFNRKPRFSANHLADYLCATTAPARTSVIRDAKFPRKPAVASYSQIKQPICQFLGGNTGDLSFFDVALRKLAEKAAREVDGYARDEALRCEAALKAFKDAFRRSRAKKYTFTAGPVDTFMKLEGVHVNVRLDAGVMETQPDGSAHSGGCVLFLANSADSRRNIEARRRYVAATVHWALESGQMPPAPRLCMSFDVFGKKMVKATETPNQLRRNMTQSCAEVALRWDKVEPPPGYDGPDWH